MVRTGEGFFTSLGFEPLPDTFWTRSMFTRPAVDLIDNPTSKPGSFGRWKSRVRGLPEFGGELPVAALAEEILTPGEGQVRALITVAGNPVLSTPNGAQLDRALDSLAFMVSIDFYLNETTRHADVILPPTCALEHDHYDLIFHAFAVRNTARYSEPLFERPVDARHDWEIFEALGDRIAARLSTKRAPHPRPDQIIDMGLKIGPYGGMKKHPLNLSLAALKAAPHGIDLGALEPCLPERLQTKGKFLLCAPPEMIAELADFARHLADETAAPGLSLIGRRHVRSNNSWMHNSQRLVKGPVRNRLLMHPADLASRGLLDGAPGGACGGGVGHGARRIGRRACRFNEVLPRSNQKHRSQREKDEETHAVGEGRQQHR